MLGNDWQFVIVALCVSAAAVVVLRRTWLVLRGGSAGCGASCGSCPSGKSSAQPLVTLDLGPSRPRS